MKVVIVVNGVLGSEERTLSIARDAHRIICADGGARHCLRLGIKPHLVVGDMDSLSPEDIEQLEAMDVPLEWHPCDKDQTDLEIALERAREWSPERILLVGAWGGRMDHAVANLLVLAADPPTGSASGEVLELVEEDQICRVLRSGQSYSFSGKPGLVVSALPLTESVGGVCYEGLKYPLQNARLKLGSSLGVSNEMVSDKARISVGKGRLLVVRTLG